MYPRNWFKLWIGKFSDVIIKNRIYKTFKCCLPNLFNSFRSENMTFFKMSFSAQDPVVSSLEPRDITYLCVKSFMALLLSFHPSFPLPAFHLSSSLGFPPSFTKDRRPPTEWPTTYFSIFFLIFSRLFFLSIGDQPTNRNNMKKKRGPNWPPTDRPTN